MPTLRLSRFVTVLTLGSLLILTAAAIVQADPCLVVYTNSPCTYHYDVNEYYTVTYGHPLYDPMYDRGGQVLLRIGTNDIDLSIYQAPNITGFVPSTNGQEGFFSIGSKFDLIIDGFNDTPTTYVNILLVFEPDPTSCTPIILVDGEPVVGSTFACGDLVVSTPTPNSHNYSDTMTKHIEWSACTGMQIWAFSDENYNGSKDGGECFSAFSHDLTVPAESRSWGAIKSIYR